MITCDDCVTMCVNMTRCSLRNSAVDSCRVLQVSRKISGSILGCGAIPRWLMRLVSISGMLISVSPVSIRKVKVMLTCPWNR